MRNLLFALVCAVATGASPASSANTSGLANTCNSCHGINGISAGPSTPSLAGLNEDYLKRVMIEQKKGDRYSTIMGRLLKSYSDEQISALAKHYAAQEWVSTEMEADWGEANRGRRILRQACKRCHGMKGDKNTDEVPRLAGQWPGYLKLETLKYVDPAFTFKKPSQDMAEAISHLTDEDVAAVSHFLGVRK